MDADAAENRGLRNNRTSSIGRSVCGLPAREEGEEHEPDDEGGDDRGGRQPLSGPWMMA